MQITQEQLTIFKELYKKEFGIELSDADAQRSALALFRFLSFQVIPFEPNLDDVK